MWAGSKGSDASLQHVTHPSVVAPHSGDEAHCSEGQCGPVRDCPTQEVTVLLTAWTRRERQGRQIASQSNHGPTRMENRREEDPQFERDAAWPNAAVWTSRGTQRLTADGIAPQPVIPGLGTERVSASAFKWERGTSVTGQGQQPAAEREHEGQWAQRREGRRGEAFAGRLCSSDCAAGSRLVWWQFLPPPPVPVPAVQCAPAASLRRWRRCSSEQAGKPPEETGSSGSPRRSDRTHAESGRPEGTSRRATGTGGRRADPLALGRSKQRAGGHKTASDKERALLQKREATNFARLDLGQF
jgi:hypothetical protein